MREFPSFTADLHALADWLTSIGYPTTAKEVTSARSQQLVMGVVPATDEVIKLWRQLQERFPMADLKPLLADPAEP